MIRRAPLPQHRPLADIPVPRQLAALKLIVTLAPHWRAIQALIGALQETTPSVEDDPLLTGQGAALAGRHIELVRRRCASGKLGYFDHTARCWRFRRSELVAFLTKRHGVDGLPAALRKNVV